MAIDKDAIRSRMTAAANRRTSANAAAQRQDFTNKLIESHAMPTQIPDAQRQYTPPPGYEGENMMVQQALHGGYVAQQDAALRQERNDSIKMAYKSRLDDIRNRRR